MKKVDGDVKIGYTVQGQAEQQQLIQAGCGEVVSKKACLSEVESFEQFIMANQDKAMVVVGLSSIGNKLTSIELFSVLTLIQKEKLDVTFLGVQKLYDISSQVYMRIIIQLVQHDKEAMSLRTIEGLAKSREEGVKSGRPAITPDLISKINYYRETKGYTIREIAYECNVSTGTAYKYSRKEKLAEQSLSNQLR